MLARKLLKLLPIVGLLVSGPWMGMARAEAVVDLELVLAVDVSLSMDIEEQRLQRDGYVAAFRDPEVHKAIASGLLGRVAVAYVEWAGPRTQATIVDWTLIDGPQAAEAFADVLAQQPITRARMTSISSALTFAADVFNESPYRGHRRVIDISGDGPNNSGRPVLGARDEVLARGVVINGLPIMLKRGSTSGFFDINNLDDYYRDCVVGGPNSFMVPIQAMEEFGPAIRKKLILEISRATLPAEVVLVADERTQSASQADCMVGELLWQRFIDDP